MPAKYISNQLCLTIRDRAYSNGALNLLKKEAEAIEANFVQQRQRLREIRRETKKLVAKIGNLDTEITKQLPVNPDNIAAIQSRPRFGSGHGVIVKNIVRILVSSSEPVPTPDIVMVLVSQFGWPYETLKEREIARRKVAKPLGVLVKKGAVTRLHDTTKNKVGLWQWAGL